MTKIVIEDWSFFNEAVMRRAKASRPQPPPMPPAPAVPLLSRPALVGAPALAPALPPSPWSVPVAATGLGQQPRPAEPSAETTSALPTGSAPTTNVPPPRAPARQSFWGELWQFIKVALGIVVTIFLLIGLLEWLGRPAAQSGFSLPSTAAILPQPVVRSSVTQFKEVEFAGGEVTTGWRFNASTDTVPVLQYCYYTHVVLNDAGTKASDAKIDIETRPGRLEPYPGNSKQLGLSERQWTEAASKCLWAE